MKNVVDQFCSGKLVRRTARDYRTKEKESSILPDYPGTKRTRRRSNKAEASLNLAYVWKGTGNPTRFSDGSWSVLYTASSRITSYVEVGYHLQQYYHPAKKRGTTLWVDHICYELNIKGKERCYMHCNKDLPNLCDSTPAGYKRCQGLGIKALREEKSFINVPSARRIGALCCAVFDQKSISKPRRVNTVKIGIIDAIDFVLVNSTGYVRKYAVSREY